jgi:two-component system, OmpR family, alkaline phosphatase synthesis response regulator PhoP
VDSRKESELILVVEDDPDLCDLIATVLEDNLKVRTVKAEDGEQALELIQKLKPDAVLLDIWLPKVTGLDVARSVRSNPQTWSIPLVAITSASLAPTIIAGCDYHFAKPFDPVVLVDKLKDLFEARPGVEVAV